VLGFVITHDTRSHVLDISRFCFTEVHALRCPTEHVRVITWAVGQIWGSQNRWAYWGQGKMSPGSTSSTFSPTTYAPLQCCWCYPLTGLMTLGLIGAEGRENPSDFSPSTCDASVRDKRSARGCLTGCLLCVLQDISGTFRLLSQSAGRTQHVSVDPPGGPVSKHSVMARQSDSSVEEIVSTHEPDVFATPGSHCLVSSFTLMLSQFYPHPWDK
jgi:hypothetical protein